MFKKIVLLFTVLIICILCFSGCKAQHKNITIKNINYEVLVDKISKSDVTASIYYDAVSLNGLKTDTYFWQEKNLVSSQDLYKPTYANKYPLKSIDNLKIKLKLSKSPLIEYGQLYFYGSASEYELFIFDCSRNGQGQWKVFLLDDSEPKEVIIKKDLAEVRLDSYQITEDAIYLYTRSKNENNSDIIIYKIDAHDLNVSKIVVPLNVFKVENVIVQLDKIFIKDNSLLLSTSSFNEGSSGKGVFLRYNLLTKTADTVFTNHTIHKVFPYKNEYLVLCDEKNSYKPCIKYYDKNLRLIKSEVINIDSQYGNAIIGARDYFFYLNNDKLHGVLSIDGKANIDYLAVVDVDNSDVLYLAELKNKDSEYVTLCVRIVVVEKIIV